MCHQPSGNTSSWRISLTGHMVSQSWIVDHGFQGQTLASLAEPFQGTYYTRSDNQHQDMSILQKETDIYGTYILIDGMTLCITAHKSQMEAIQKLNQPKSARECKSFCGVVTFLSIYLKDLQKHLIPICKLTKKNRPF